MPRRERIKRLGLSDLSSQCRARSMIQKTDDGKLVTKRICLYACWFAGRAFFSFFFFFSFFSLDLSTELRQCDCKHIFCTTIPFPVNIFGVFSFFLFRFSTFFLGLYNFDTLLGTRVKGSVSNLRVLSSSSAGRYQFGFNVFVLIPGFSFLLEQSERLLRGCEDLMSVQRTFTGSFLFTF